MPDSEDSAIKTAIKIKYIVNIDEIQIPEYVLIPLETENSISKLYVVEHQRIEEGQILSKNINVDLYTYSPISGIIEKIYVANLPNGQQLKSALIRFQGRIKNEKKQSDEIESREKTLERLIRLGIPWFNDNSLFQYVSKCKKIDKMILLINGRDSFTNISEILIKEKLDEILYGLEIVDKIFKFKEILIALSNCNLKKELENLIDCQDKRLRIRLIPNISQPYSNHEMIMHFLYNEKNIQESINPNKNILLANVEDLCNVHSAIKTNIPYKEKFITINGNQKIKSKIIKVKIGTSIRQIINEDIDTKKYDVFLNNPVNKIKINNLNVPITRDIYSITILKKKSMLFNLKFFKIPSFSPLHIEEVILSKIKGKNEHENKKFQFLQYTEAEIEEEISKVQREIKEKILNITPKNEPIYTENNLKDIYLTIILALVPSLIFSFSNNTKFLIDTFILTIVSMVAYSPVMFKAKHKCLSFFIYTALITSMIFPLNLSIILKIISLLFTFLVFFYFSKLSKFLVNPILISFMFLLLNFPSSFKQTYSGELSRQEDMIPTWDKAMQKNPNIKGLEGLKEAKRNENKYINMIEEVTNKQILSHLNIIIPRFHIESLFGLQNEKYLSPILLYIGFSFILGKFILNKLIPLSFYASLLLLAYVFKNMNIYSHITLDMLSLATSPILMLLIFAISTELQTAPSFKFEQILYGCMLSMLYLMILGHIPFETLSAVISIFVLQISSTLIKKYSITFQIKKILHHLSINKEKATEHKNENGEEIIKL
ncbi:RnfABCDGE type electron transport complex subunit D [Borrelia sp. P9F1]|uniref:RnfABCDGE type electron transport complex subunit D n=1 Tax=Borrelia sp. P9F1 TaxID=3058374 RepID=UPI0026478268|nr:RnfABCDGE type electron transport complex subunit D [Borrelia sp. P9F1]WKC57659.1 RnfABCDGE type electron transport complex subunit D [Borrelia sp. P9F1]